MEMIDRYVYTVIKNLPESMREDVEKELRINIDDMLPDSYGQSDVEDVLHKLGNPHVLADEYRGSKRYLIGPAAYSTYIFTLRLVLIIALSFIPVTAVIPVITDPKILSSADMASKILSVLFSAVFDTAAQIFAWVTVIFIILDRINKKIIWPYNKKDWTINDLEELPGSHGKIIKKVDPVFSIIGITVFTAIICFFPELIAMYLSENEIINKIPFFNLAAFEKYIPAIMVVSVYGLVVAIQKIAYGKWILKLAIHNAVKNVAGIFVSAAILFNGNIINEQFIVKMAELIGTSYEKVSFGWQRGFVGVFVFICFSSIWDLVKGFINARKKI